MTSWAHTYHPPPSPLAVAGKVFFALSAASAAALLLSLAASTTITTTVKKGRSKTSIIPSPLKTQLPSLSPDEIAALPYPPDVLPGGRTVDTPYGSIRVFEFGPETGEKVLLLHGISTPCLALGTVAEELAGKGYRVMLFDFFGRGYSDAPADVEYDLRLYTTQILLVLASSRLAWTGDDGFHLVGYSLGGGITVPFARYFPRMVRSVVVVAGGGLIREKHVSWRSRMLYSTGLFPEGLLQVLIRRRLMRGLREEAATGETEMAAEVVAIETEHKNSDASGGHSFDNSLLLARRPGYTVSSVMSWQLRHHQGFIPAFVSSIRHAPIYDHKEDWSALGKLLAERRERAGWEDMPDELSGLRGGMMLFVLGAEDPVILKEELIHDATAVLGEDGFEAVVFNCGHELVMTNGPEVADVVDRFWKRLP